jgi:2-dehydro-3-deoxygluconokinase
LSGYGLLENFRKDTIKVLKFAKRNGMITCMDPDLKSYRQFDAREMKNVLKFVDFFFPDLEEGKVIVKEKDKMKIVEKLLKLGCKTVALKLGREGCIVADENNLLMLGPIETNAINSTGAGDFFNAGFVFGYTKHKDLESAGIFGNAVAAFAISRFGDERYPCRAEVEKLVKGYEWKEK